MPSVSRKLFKKVIQIDQLQWLIGPLFRKQFNFTEHSPESITIKIADQIDELKQSVQIINDCYKVLGFMDPTHKINEINKHQLLPHAIIIVAKDAHRVVGTMTLVKKFSFELPLQDVFEIDTDIEPHDTVAEITCLAIDRNYRRSKGHNVLLLLFKYMYQYATQNFGINKLFLVCLPEHSFFYRALFGFNNIKKNSYIKAYKGAPARALKLDLNDAYKKMQHWFGTRPESQNLFHFFTKKQLPQLELPDLDYFRTTDLSWSREKLNLLLNSGQYQMPPLTREEEDYLVNLYLNHPMQIFFNSTAVFSEKRQHRRLSANLDLSLAQAPNQNWVSAKTISISLISVAIVIRTELKLGEEYQVKIQISKNEISCVQATVYKLTKSQNVFHAVLIIKSPDLVWFRYLSYLYN